MNLENLISQLSAFGTIEFCGHNGDDQTRLIISILNVDNSTQNVENMSTLINSFIQTDFPVIEHFQIHESILKAVYKIN